MTSMNFTSNQIGDEGANELAEALKQTNREDHQSDS